VPVKHEIGGEKQMRIDTTAIELLLAERRWTRTELAERSGISRQNVSTILRRGTAEPKSVGRLAAALGVKGRDIIGREG